MLTCVHDIRNASAHIRSMQAGLANSTANFHSRLSQLIIFTRVRKSECQKQGVQLDVQSINWAMQGRLTDLTSSVQQIVIVGHGHCQ